MNEPHFPKHVHGCVAAGMREQSHNLRQVAVSAVSKIRLESSLAYQIRLGGIGQFQKQPYRK